MKFIGQYIQDFIARFRSDVYLEDISTGTIASGGNLGLDSNNKIVKNTVSGGTTDLTSDVTGVLPIANGGTNSNSAANARTALGVDPAGTDNSTNVTLAGSLDYITLSGQEITRNAIDLTADVTGALPKANLATQNAYQYISLTGNITANTTGNGYWKYPSPNGISNHTWNQTVKKTTGGANNRDTTTVGDEVGIDRLNNGSSGIRIPYAGTIVGFTGSGRNAGSGGTGDRVYYAGLFVGTPDWGTNNDINAELVAVATADNNSGNYYNRPSKLEDLSRSYSISAGDVIYPAFKGSGTNADIIQANITIVIKTTLV